MFLDTGPLFAGGSFGFLNCAELEAPWHDVACDEGGTDITVTKTAPAACVPGADCTFTVTITNTGAFPFSGPVQFTDSTFMGWPFPGPFGLPITSIVPALGCAPPPAAIDFSCVATLTLAPGESEVFAITVPMPLAGAFPGYWVQNCFAVSAPGAAPPALPLAPGADNNLISCVWVPVGAPPPLSNLRLDKRALNSGDCYKVGAALIRCDYEIEIFNDGPSPFGGHHLQRRHSGRGNARRLLPAGWVCFGGPPSACSLAPARHSRRRLDRRSHHRDDPAGAARSGRLRHAEHRDDHWAGRHE